MINRKGDLSQHERAFVDHFARHGDAVAAAQKAGYAQPRSGGYLALNRPKVMAEVIRLQSEIVTQEILPLAVQAHKQMLADPRTPAGAKVQAIKLAYDRVFGTQEGHGKDLHEMTGEELASLLKELEHVASDRAKPVESVDIPQTAPNVFA